MASYLTSVWSNWYTVYCGLWNLAPCETTHTWTKCCNQCLYTFKCLERDAHAPKLFMGSYLEWSVIESSFYLLCALWLCCQATQAWDCQWVGTQKNWVAEVDCRACPYVRKVKRDNLEQYFVFHTLYSGEFCWICSYMRFTLPRHSTVDKRRFRSQSRCTGEWNVCHVTKWQMG